ncbi:MAG: hypothetical protein JWO08_1686 [Verrucomicrobiaceae bacterium]|nr:hypothetical protein [Verrucomicrobiaceae bacterium]
MLAVKTTPDNPRLSQQDSDTVAGFNAGYQSAGQGTNPSVERCAARPWGIGLRLTMRTLIMIQHLSQTWLRASARTQVLTVVDMLGQSHHSVGQSFASSIPLNP